MLRKYVSLIVAITLIGLVATACIVRSRPYRQTGQPVYVEKQKPQKHKKMKHKKHKH
jgi:hypothetical protein